MKKKKDARGWMALKIDLEKAYDRVSWEFVEKVLMAFGFSPIWVKWVITCITSGTMQLMLNGSCFQDFTPKIGLRQGDLLSPYLFILCTEVLSQLIMRKVESGDIHELKLTRGGPHLHHFLFADDIFLFGKACEEEAVHFKGCLDMFCSWSGLSFNSTKSNIFFSKNTKSRTIAHLSCFMGFTRIPLSNCYLGMPLFRASRVNDFNFLVECLDSKLARWKARLLSKAAQLALIKSVALSMHIYAMHSAKIPKAICLKMDARIRRFWWGSSDHSTRSLCLKAWDDICVPKGDGGLGFRWMKDMNHALITKWGGIY
ncbi:hypothetical protein UlMin_008096 [Ulmus minor]